MWTMRQEACEERLPHECAREPGLKTRPATPARLGNVYGATPRCGGCLTARARARRLVPVCAAWHPVCSRFGMGRRHHRRQPLPLWRRLRWALLVNFVLVLIGAAMVIKAFLLLLGRAV
jgi:hypothetical protein